MLRTARDLEKERGVPRRTTYGLARRGLVQVYRVGEKKTGLRFLTEDVMAALREKPSATVEEKVGA